MNPGEIVLSYLIHIHDKKAEIVAVSLLAPVLDLVKLFSKELPLHLAERTLVDNHPIVKIGILCLTQGAGASHEVKAPNIGPFQHISVHVFPFDPKALFGEFPETGVKKSIYAMRGQRMIEISGQVWRIHVYQEGNGMEQVQLLFREISYDFP
jgi:hypothetical protein